MEISNDLGPSVRTEKRLRVPTKSTKKKNLEPESPKKYTPELGGGFKYF